MLLGSFIQGYCFRLDPSTPKKKLSLPTSIEQHRLFCLIVFETYHQDKTCFIIWTTLKLEPYPRLLLICQYTGYHMAIFRSQLRNMNTFAKLWPNTLSTNEPLRDLQYSPSVGFREFGILRLVGLVGGIDGLNFGGWYAKKLVFSLFFMLKSRHFWHHDLQHLFWHHACSSARNVVISSHFSYTLEIFHNLKMEAP